MFDVLYENLRCIVPTVQPYEQERAAWLSEVLPAMQKELRQILLMHDGDALAGYFQYYVNNGILMVEEIQLKAAYQRSHALYRLCCFLKHILPEDILFIEAYAHKLNANSQSVIKSFGMERIEEKGELWHYRGDYKTVWEQF